MKKMNMILLFCLAILYSSCNENLIEYKTDDVKIVVEKGENYLHDFPLFLGIKKKNPPQIAIWMEDLEGNYLSTIYVTKKIATGKWQSAGSNRRKEALPHWCHRRGIQYDDGLYLPTKAKPFIDGISGATPTGNFDVKLKPHKELKQFIVKIEINHSTDFNDNFPKYAEIGDIGYSGGKEGSGQPAIIYAATVDLTSGETVFKANRIGHSSADGTTGDIQSDVSSLTTALTIIKQITIIRQ